MIKKNKSLGIDFENIVRQLLLILTVAGVTSAVFYAFTNLTFPKNVNVVLILPFIFFLTPYLILSLYKIKKIEAKMQVIPRFLRDIVDNVESGMDLVSSIKNTSGNEYTVLNDDIRKLVNQLSWGISFEDALKSFAEKVGSASLKRDFLLVVEARKIGGHVEKILRELSEKINIENLRNNERKSNLASNTFTGYISFLIFIFIIVLTYNNLFLGLGESLSASQEQSNVQTSGITVDDKLTSYLTLLLLLSYELSILSGFLFGLMQENNIISGAPHVVVLVILTFAAFFFFIKL